MGSDIEKLADRRRARKATWLRDRPGATDIAVEQALLDRCIMEQPVEKPGIEAVTSAGGIDDLGRDSLHKMLLAVDHGA